MRFLRRNPLPDVRSKPGDGAGNKVTIDINKDSLSLNEDFIMFRLAPVNASGFLHSGSMAIVHNNSQ